jgi:energy-coupling factor transport system permease protein
MSSRYDLYQPGDSWLHRLDPRVKLLLVVCGSLVLLVFVNLGVMIAALLLTQAALWSAGVSRERIGAVWKALLPTMILVAVFWVILYPGEGRALLSFWIVHITAASLAQALAIALRLGALAFTIFLWLFTTDQSTLVRSLVALGLPYTWGLTLAIALRYLPTMANSLRMVSDAQQARALDLTRGNLLKRGRAYIPIIVAMIITALRTAENLSRALESRAFGAPRQRTFLRQLTFRRANLAWTIGILLVTALLLWVRFAL